MEANNHNFKESKSSIDYNNFNVRVNTNLRKRQPNQFNFLNIQTREKRPTFTRIKTFSNTKTNNSPNVNRYNLVLNNSYQRPRTNNRYISSNVTRTEENKPSFKNSSSYNNLFNNVMNKNKDKNYQNNIINDQNNYTMNYTMRDSNYSLFSASAFSSLTYNDLNSKYNYYKVLFHQLKGHNLALLDQLKKDKDLKVIIKSLEQEINRLKNENHNLKEYVNIPIKENDKEIFKI